MPDIILNGKTYTGIDKMTAPLADGSGEVEFSEGGGSGGSAYPNGKEWTKCAIGSSDNMLGYMVDIVKVKNVWVGFGYGGLWYSTDGKEWVQAVDSTGETLSCWFNCVVYANGLFVAASDYEGTGIYYSTDGVTWTQSNITSGGAMSLIYEKGIWLASHYGGGFLNVSYSLDGKTWTNVNAGGYCYDFAYGGGVFVVTSGSYGIFYSEDGKTWTQSNITDLTYVRAIAYKNGVFVFGSCRNDAGLYYSEDGKTWTQSNITSGKFDTVKYVDHLWFASDSTNLTGIYYSTDGITWTQSNITSGSINEDLCCNNGLFVVAMSNGLFYSMDGKTWTQSNIADVNIMSVLCGCGKWVALSETSSYYSDDGKTWEALSVTSQMSFIIVRYVDGIWYIISIDILDESTYEMYSTLYYSLAYEYAT